MDRLEIMETLKHLPDAIEAEVNGQTDWLLRLRPERERWSIKEIAGHLRDHVEMTHKYLYMVWSLNDPVLPSYDADGLVIDRGYQDADLGKIIAGLREKRLETVMLLAHAVDWTRLGQLQGVGRRSLKQLTEMALLHEQECLEQIRTIKIGSATAAR